MAQNEPLVEFHRRRDDWPAQRIREAFFAIECLDSVLAIGTIYEGLPPVEGV